MFKISVSTRKHLDKIISSMFQFNLSPLLFLKPTLLFLLAPSFPFFPPPFCFFSRRFSWRQEWDRSFCKVHQCNIFISHIFIATIYFHTICRLKFNASFCKSESSSLSSLVFSPKAGFGRNQSPVRRPVWLWHTAF